MTPMPRVMVGVVLAGVIGLAACSDGEPGPSASAYAACERADEIVDRHCDDGGCAPSELSRATYDHFVEIAMTHTGLSHDALFERLSVLDIHQSDGLIYLAYYLR